MHFRLRGSRPVSESLFLVYVGSEDIAELGGWPLTRDYYGYLLHVLKDLKSRTVGLDIMFSSPDRHHPEYDQLLSDFIAAHGNICLPMTFAEMDGEDKREPEGSEPAFPLKQLEESAAGLGFSNIGDELVVRRPPVVARYNEKAVLSFGAELARLHLGSGKDIFTDGRELRMPDSSGNWRRFSLDAGGELLLNHFGDIEEIPSISLVNLFKQYRQHPDTLLLKDKLVLVAVTAPGTAALVSTPLNSLFPASLIHATVAENILSENSIRQPGQLVNVMILLIFAAIPVFLAGRLQGRQLLVVISGIILLSWFGAHAVFIWLNGSVTLFYPVLGLLLNTAIQSGYVIKQRRNEDAALRSLLNEQVSFKTSQLQAAREELNLLKSQLTEEEQLSRQVRERTEAQNAAIRKLEKEVRDLKQYDLSQEKAAKLPDFKEIVHAPDSKLRDVLQMVMKVSDDDIPVLITGETGTGKEMIAHTIHRTGLRKTAPFIAVNCGALSETLLESELFGHEKGSFTGAVSRRKGRFERADGGTIFLDEISETSASFQAKLLRVLQEGTFERLGAEQTLRADVRIIAATNKDLQAEQAENRFRSDLFYRLNGFPIQLPPLRGRQSDIPLLCAHFLKKYGFERITGISDRAMDLMRGYAWPGNVRELENTVRRAAILAQSAGREQIREADLPEEMRHMDRGDVLAEVHVPLEDQILQSLRRLAFSRSAIKETARALGNRDRGTITEYFRGICFEHLVQCGFDCEAACKSIAGQDEGAQAETVANVKRKLNAYMDNLNNIREKSSTEDLSSAYKGLPKKYHAYLDQVIANLDTLTG